MCVFTFAGKGNLEGSAVLGVWIAVKGGGHEWVISWGDVENKNQTLNTNLFSHPTHNLQGLGKPQALE